MRDETYLAALRDFYAEHKVLPSYAGIARLLGLRSTSSVSALAGRLKEQGYLEAGPSGRLAPGPRFFERALLDAVGSRAGAALSVDDHLVPVPSKSVLLRLKDDSMKDAGLLEGDMVVVQKGAPAKPGDVVVAIVQNEFTVKTLMWDEKMREFYLAPANKGCAPIRPHAELEIFGKVVSSFRAYGPEDGARPVTANPEG